ncbi:MAG: GNAT family N-acetyltransferase [Pseudomonadales bacterium]|nr:GNAT family N-acetyltransferase [Pseudomonadales bacterium]NRA17909.1 GNAT family N-acetyltransferase [Oceanospirillaceae bacterium]
MKIESQRLILRSMLQSDQDDFFNHRLDHENFIYIGLAQEKQQVAERFAEIMSGWKGSEGEKLALAIELKSTGSMAGDLMFKYQSHSHQIAEIGYALKTDFQGQGIATEAAKMLVDYVFNELPVNKIVAYCDPRNTASFSLMEKLGMRREGHLRENMRIGDQWCDTYCYALLKRDWRQSNEQK